MSSGRAVLFPLLSALLLVVGTASCKRNRAPDVPAVPTGPAYCMRDTTYTVTTTAADPDGDSVAVRFDWGDSTPSYWVGWFASGDTVVMTHAWQDTGTYEVHAWAQDRKLVTSDSSAGLTVRVGLRRPPNTPSAPGGPDRGGQGSSNAFTARAFHPDGIRVSVRFAWGDGDTSDWSPFPPSGSPVMKSHVWSAPGTYAVTVQARDTGNALSGWSAPHEIVIEPGTSCLWRLRLAAGFGFYLASSPAIGPDGTIYIGSTDSALYAVNPDGTLKWRFLTGGWVRSSPAIAPDGTIYIGSCDSSLYAVNPDGTLRWRYVTGGCVSSSPAIAVDGAVYFGSDDSYFYALNADGTLEWSFLTGGAISSSPAIAAGGTVYIGSDRYIYALNPDGTLKWRHDVGYNLDCASPAVGADGTIYGGRAGGLCALNPDGSLRWSFSAGGAVRSSPAIAVDGTIYFGVSGDAWWGESSYFYALNSDGTSKWSYVLSGTAMSSSPAVSAFGTIYFGSYGYMNALSPDATLKWRYEAGDGAASSPTIGSDGTVYFTCTSYSPSGGTGYLYALKGTSPLADSPWPKFRHDLQNTGRASGSEGRLRMVGRPILPVDSSGFRINIVNTGMIDLTVNWLWCFDTNPDSAFMRSFVIDGNFGAGYPIPNGLPATGPGDTVWFASPVTISRNMSEMVELLFLDFYTTEYGLGQRANVHDKVFRYLFDDGSEIEVVP